VVADAEGEALGDLATFRAFLDARRDTSLPLTLTTPEARDVRIAVTVEYDPAFFDFQVEAAVRDALAGASDEAPGLFTFRGRTFGEPAHLSQVYRTVNAARGVLFTEITAFDLAPASGLHDAIRVAAHEWLRMDPVNLGILTKRRKV
jgi:hypothetical protein